MGNVNGQPVIPPAAGVNCTATSRAVARNGGIGGGNVISREQFPNRSTSTAKEMHTTRPTITEYTKGLPLDAVHVHLKSDAVTTEMVVGDKRDGQVLLTLRKEMMLIELPEHMLPVGIEIGNVVEISIRSSQKKNSERQQQLQQQFNTIEKQLQVPGYDQEYINHALHAIPTYHEELFGKS